MNLTQGSLSVSAYFTKLKIIWNELGNFKPICTCGNCSCDGTSELVEHCHMEYVMSFLMGCMIILLNQLKVSSFLKCITFYNFLMTLIFF